MRAVFRPWRHVNSSLLSETLLCPTVAMSVARRFCGAAIEVYHIAVICRTVHVRTWSMNDHVRTWTSLHLNLLTFLHKWLVHALGRHQSDLLDDGVESGSRCQGPRLQHHPRLYWWQRRSDVRRHFVPLRELADAGQHHFSYVLVYATLSLSLSSPQVALVVLFFNRPYTVALMLGPTVLRLSSVTWLNGAS